MSVIGEFSIPAASFALGDALAEHPEIVVDAERMATHSTMQVMPFLWATGGDGDAFLDALERDSTVEEVSISEKTDDGVLYKVRWNEEFSDLIDSIVDHHGAMLGATGGDGEWHLKLRFAQESHVTEFQDYFHGHGRTFEVHRLYRPSAPRQREYDLTADQYDTLVTAYDAGYFDVPRTTSTEDLAAKLDVSANAISARIRRASSNLVGSTLILGDGEGADRK